MPTRRRFVAVLPAAFLTTIARTKRAIAAQVVTSHPTPRPGITAAHVLTAEQLGTEHADAAPVFDMVREIPQVVDGIRCYCGCAELEGSYSLLSCYEAEGMAGHCEICQGEGRLAYRLHKRGKSLNEIRAAIDAKFA